MATVILVIHLMLALAIIALALLQRSEGGGLGIGGGGGGLGSFATAGQTANALTRATAICAALFFTTSIVLGIMSGAHSRAPTMLDSLDNPPAVVDTKAPDGKTDTGSSTPTNDHAPVKEKAPVDSNAPVVAPQSDDAKAAKEDIKAGTDVKKTDPKTETKSETKPAESSSTPSAPISE